MLHNSCILFDEFLVSLAYNLVANFLMSLQPHTENADDSILGFLVPHTYQQLAEPIKLESYKPLSN